MKTAKGSSKVSAKKKAVPSGNSEKKIVIGNLKMNLINVAERKKYLDWLDKAIKKKSLLRTEVVVCPPYVHLESFRSALGKDIILGAQDCFSEDKGSFTGEISPLMLKNLGCEYVILGHSERRRYQGETGDEISQKVLAVLKNGLRPIICVGEKKEERDDGKTMEVINRQVIESLSRIRPGMLEKVVIAYEPVWAVGSDEVPTSNDTMGARLLILKVLTEIFGKKYAGKVRIIYGGSISTRFVKETCIDPEMDGGLVGRESLLPNELVRIAEMIDREC